MNWFYSGSVYKSAGELNRLVQEVILAEDFDREELRDFSADRAMKQLDRLGSTSADAAQGPPTGTATPPNGWNIGSVKIRVPKENHLCSAGEEGAPELTVSGIWYRKLVDIVVAAATASSARRAHWIPFEFLWSPPPPAPTPSSAPSSSSTVNEHPSPPPQRLYSEVYNSQAMLDADAKLSSQPRHPDDTADVEYVVAPIMLGSDSTHLTNFGSAALWPIYAWFGWLSKYERGRPNALAAHHLAYIPSLPTTIQQWYEDTYGEPATESILRFCKRELMQKIWELLLDDDFLRAYRDGILVECADKIVRRIFPRIFTYSADYPEKCLIACIKSLAKCPCPDCHVQKSNIYLLGTKRDMARREKEPRTYSEHLIWWIETVRRWVFKDGIDPESSRVNNSPLNNHSSTSTRSAFSTRLAEFGFDVYRILVPDLLHEFELGVWKSTFIHLLRILIANGGAGLQQLDRRYSQVPTFGRDTIRRFGGNVSALKKLAARDFEDILQCAIPCFENLLPAACNKIVLNLLFRLATWHALAKLRLHSETTLTHLEEATSLLGASERAFVSKVCSLYATKELPKETASRHRRKAAKVARCGPSTTGQKRGRGAISVPSKIKVLDYNTYKNHRLGDYPRTIRMYGTSDGWTAQILEQEHHRVKKFYPRTNKTCGFVAQIARQQHHQALLHEVIPDRSKTHPRPTKRRKLNRKLGRRLKPPTSVVDALPHTTPSDIHHYISSEQSEHTDLYTFMKDGEEDPACIDFEYKLKTHLYERLTGNEPQDVHDRASVVIRNDCLYPHRVIRVNYTSYDKRRAQDSINPGNHADIMLVAPQGASHPYLYARVLSVFHVNAHLYRTTEDPRPIHVLWIRWFELDNSAPGGFHSLRPHRLKFVRSEDAFDFISPDQVLRSVHLIPAFAHGRSDDTLEGPSVARIETDDLEEDWKYHYVGMWSDRDLFMRFFGGAVGHQTVTPQALQPLSNIASEITEARSDVRCLVLVVAA
ncbi:uncharacterized protein BXZ73DRAFT_52743 [Epithele typhae]|uniref:uncharacterized protein n=1 Tax=Epithele typhae TaxID=378194 RepID=UPI0020075679|nr:uncharacterized protein BXZ73DRAFT_52743 [Epithele typhae]KAH9918886.1 hypothetical protein BXZ73DRAFT_52743 [Epithele typhae]